MALMVCLLGFICPRGVVETPIIPLGVGETLLLNPRGLFAMNAPKVLVASIVTESREAWFYGLGKKEHCAGNTNYTRGIS